MGTAYNRRSGRPLQVLSPRRAALAPEVWIYLGYAMLACHAAHELNTHIDIIDLSINRVRVSRCFLVIYGCNCSSGIMLRQGG